MGRKIPAKKHRGVKDPIEQQARRLQSVKGKINAPPGDPDEQPIPRSLQRLFAPNTPTPAPRRITHKQGNQNKDGGVSVGDNPVSRLRVLPGESGRDFSLRINSAVRALHGGGAGTLHYPCEDDEEEEDNKGTRMAELRERRARKQRRAGHTRRGAGAGAGAEAEAGPAPALTRTQKLALKRKAKKEKISERSVERREVQFERVPFGEVAHAPPTLHSRKGLPGRNAPGAPRPGRRGLLLSALLQGGGRAPPPPLAAEAARRERARLDAVAAYRALKAERVT